MTLQVETAIIYNYNDYFNDTSDNKFFLICIVYLVSYHVFFFFYSAFVRQQEQSKLILDSDEIEREVNFNRPALAFNYRRAQRMGRSDRLLVFKAMTKEEEQEYEHKWK